MGLYIVANVDGNVISSTDGLEWSAPFDTGISIGKVAISSDKIVYTGNGEESDSYGLFYTSAWNVAPTQAEGTEDYYFNEVHYLGGKFIAVGFQRTVSPKTPAFAYSEDGQNWIMGNIDPEYIEFIGAGNDLMFTDVGYNGIGYFIIGIQSAEGGENDKAGGFYVIDLMQPLDESNFVSPLNFPTDARQLVYASYPEGGESFGAWSAFSDDGKTWWSTYNEDPSQPWSFIEGWDLSEALFNGVGLQELEIAEATIGLLNYEGGEGGQYVTWMLSTTDGQVIWWPHEPAGPFVSIPNPYTASVNSVENLNPLQVTFSGEEVYNNEKITISGATGLTNLNGTYFVKDVGGGVYELYSTKELDSTIDASAWSGSYVSDSATATLSHGTYIDALGYGDGKFFAGNDDEEVFMCSQIESENLVWVEVDDKNNSLEYWNDVDYGDFSSCNNQEFVLSLTPQNPETIPNYYYDGEGNMDTSIIINESGQRVSIQRTGYIDTIDGCGNRKISAVNDGESYSDTPNSN